ncbi:hypothetical protein [Tropicimonas marinistellae]|uniref:hypothetical protein n=1 Tax=Tropicimonas marinistellae TaxID=1739787 RepID=UPI000834225C|nr:hypothetical protein [Tropicimonas marinistellae]
MLNHTNIATACVAFVIASSAAFAQDIYAEVEGWNVRVAEGLKGCAIERTDADGFQTQIGIDGNQEMGYVALFTLADAGIDSRDTIITHFDLDGERFVGDSVRKVDGAYQGGYVYFNNPNFAYDLAKKQTLTITAESGREIAVDLTGTNAAMEVMRECQMAQQ